MESSLAGDKEFARVRINCLKYFSDVRLCKNNHAQLTQLSKV